MCWKSELGVEFDLVLSMLTPVLSCLLDAHLVFCWISRCPGELGVAVMGLMVRVQSAL